MTVHERPEPVAVVHLYGMAQLVQQDVIYEPVRQCYKTDVKTNVPG